MSDAMILATPVLAFFIVGLFGFVGCASFSAAPGDEEPPPTESKPPETPPAPPATPPVTPPAPVTYEDVIKATSGFAALWPLNEPLLPTAAVVGPLSPSANGTYTDTTGGTPAPGSVALGKAGVRFAKDSTDAAPEFAGTDAFIDVPFHAQLNPAANVPGFSIELWVKPNPNAGPGRGVVVSSYHFESAAKQQGYEIGLLKVAGQAHQQIYARVYSGTGNTITEVTVQPVDGQPEDWRHVVFKYELVPGTGYAIRLHAQVVGSVQVHDAETTPVSYENVTAAKSSTLRFAASNPSTSGGGVAVFAGRIDNVAFYNAALTPADIKKHYDMV